MPDSKEYKVLDCGFLADGGTVLPEPNEGILDNLLRVFPGLGVFQA